MAVERTSYEGVAFESQGLLLGNRVIGIQYPAAQIAQNTTPSSPSSPLAAFLPTQEVS